MRNEIKNGKFYVYVYLDPRKSGIYKYDDLIFDYEPFYIGKGKNNRLYNHLNNVKFNKNSRDKNLLKCGKIKKILKENLEPIILKINNFNEEYKASEYEIYLIEKIGRFDLNLGPLSNLTDGGDGVMNMNEETKKKISKSLKGNKYKNNGKFKIGRIPYNKGDKLPDYTKKKISETLKKKYSGTDCDKWKQLHSKIRKNKKHSKETKKKISESLKNAYQKGRKSRKGCIPWNKGLKKVINDGEIIWVNKKLVW